MTGLIYVAIIAVWAVVLVPQWLRRHDRLDPQRSVSRFSRSMQALAERPSVLGIPLTSERDGQSRASDSTSATAADPQAEVRRVTRPSAPTAKASRKAAGQAIEKAAGSGRKAAAAGARAGASMRGSSAASRRRVVLAVLTAGLVGVVGLVAAGVLLPIAIAAPVALMGGFVVAARSQVTRERARREAGRRPATVPATASASPTVRRTPSTATGGTWEARPTTLPTYVTAPPASGFPRVIDTETPGAWTAAAMLERAQQEKLRAERMAAAKAEAIAKAKAEQAAAEARSRDEEFLSDQAIEWNVRSRDTGYPRRAVNE